MLTRLNRLFLNLSQPEFTLHIKQIELVYFHGFCLHLPVLSVIKASFLCCRVGKARGEKSITIQECSNKPIIKLRANLVS